MGIAGVPYNARAGITPSFRRRNEPVGVGIRHDRGVVPHRALSNYETAKCSRRMAAVNDVRR